MKKTLSARNRAKICLRYNFLIGLKRRESVFLTCRYSAGKPIFSMRILTGLKSLSTSIKPLKFLLIARLSSFQFGRRFSSSAMETIIFTRLSQTQEEETYRKFLNKLIDEIKQLQSTQTCRNLEVQKIRPFFLLLVSPILSVCRRALGSHKLTDL